MSDITISTLQLNNLLVNLRTRIYNETNNVNEIKFTVYDKLTLDHLSYNAVTDKVETDRAVETTLNSLYLGDQHKMSSGSENIYFTNLTSKVNFYPMWGGIKDQSVVENQTDDGVYVPTARVFSSYGVAKLGGDPVLDTAIPYDGDNFFPFNISGMGITTVVAEDVPIETRLKYELSVNGTPVYDQILTHTGLVVNQTLSWFFDHPLDIVGSPTTFNHASIRKIDSKENDLGLLLVCQGSDEVRWGGIRYQTNVQNRLFQDKEIAFDNDLDYLNISGYYDLYVDPSYVGTNSNGTNIRPYTILATAIAASSAGNTIFIKGENITTEIVLPHSLSFYGIDGTKIKYAAYDSTNTNLLKFTGTDNTSRFIFKNIEFNNAGEYAIKITGGAASVDIIDCKFRYNGWNGSNLNTVLSSADSSTLGYDSTQAELQAFYASTAASNGGAMRIETVTNVQIIGNKLLNNLRGIRIADCGIDGNGFITRNVSAQNIESGIYLASGSLLGCQNITVTMNFSSYNANNGLLVIGGINNKFSQNEVNGNWNAGLCAWGAANTTLRDSGLYNNNRSNYNGIGNIGDAKASIQINENLNLLGNIITLNTDARFICEILDTQVHYTGLGSNTDKIGVLITSDVGNLADNDKNIIKIDDVGFIGQDYAIDLSEIDITNLRLSLGDNSYQSINIKAVKPPIAGNYSELPFSNHVMAIPVLDVVVDTLKQIIHLKDSVGGNVINTYKTNELQSIINGSKVDIIQTNTNKIQLRGLTYSNVYINGVIAGNSLNSMNDSLNNAFNMDLIEYTEFLSSTVGLNSDALIIPSNANNWYISFGSRIDEQILVPSIVSDLKDEQPFYYVNSLVKGNEFLWTHDNTGDFIIGIYTDTIQTTEQNIFNSSNWGVGFRYVRSSGRISGTNSFGVTINSNNDTTTNQWDVTNNTVFALRYGNDNFLYLLDISGLTEVIIGRSILTQSSDSVTISFGGENQPNAKFPIIIERTERWSIVHDYDNSENNEWIDGIENKTIIKSNMSISPGEKFTWTLPATWTNRYYAIGYTGSTSGDNETNIFMTNRWRWHSSYTLQNATSQGWIMNTSNSLYNSGSGQWNPTHGNSTLVSYRYLSNNTLEMWDETYGEKIMTLGNSILEPIHLYFGAKSYASSYSQIPILTKYSIINEPDTVVNDTTWYYIESPDGSFYYPLFKTEEEANYIDTVEGGSGTSHTHTFLDDPTNTTWYMPSTNGVHAGSTAPQHGVFGNSVNVLWNEQSTEDDTNYIPTFTNITYNVQEGSAINIVYKTSGDTNTYNISNIPGGYADNGTAIIGTAEDITNGYGQAVTHTLNVTKANNFGSVQGTITINVLANLSSNEFTLVDDNGTIKFTQDGGVTLLDFNTVTFQAGQTYKFYLDDSSLQTNDIVNIVDINGNSILGNDGLTQIGPGAGYAGTHYQYAIPSDVEPGKFITFTDGATNTSYTDIPLTIAGSTYTVGITGITLEGPSANQTGTNVMDSYEHGWISLNEQLSAGERLVLDNAFLENFFNTLRNCGGNSNTSGISCTIGLRGDNFTNTAEIHDHDISGQFKGNHYIRLSVLGVRTRGAGWVIHSNGVQGNVGSVNTTAGFASACGFLEITSSGNNIRSGMGTNGSYGIVQGDESTKTYDNWTGYKRQTGEEGYGITSLDVVIGFWTFNATGLDGSLIDWTQITEVSVPTTLQSGSTSFTKAVDFVSNSNAWMQMVNSGDSRWPALKLPSRTVSAHSSSSTKTSDDSNALPWLTSCVFQPGPSSAFYHGEQIWSVGDGIGTSAVNIMLEQIGTDVFFSWGQKANYNGSIPQDNTIRIIENADSTKWYGVYVAHRGHRSTSPSASDLASMFDIYVMSSDDSFASIGSNISTAVEWGQSWNRTGLDLTLSTSTSSKLQFGGNNGYYGNSFNGKIASAVMHGLMRDVDMPDSTEIKKSIVDPIGWADDMVGTNQYSYYDTIYTYIVNDYISALSTQVYLFGDGTNDSFSSFIRNQVHPTDSVYVPLTMTNMYANDIVNVSIPGLS